MIGVALGAEIPQIGVRGHGVRLVEALQRWDCAHLPSASVAPGAPRLEPIDDRASGEAEQLAEFARG